VICKSRATEFKRHATLYSCCDAINSHGSASQDATNTHAGTLDTSLNSFVTSQVLQTGINNIPYTQGSDAKSLGSFHTWLQQHIVKLSTSHNTDPLTATSSNTEKLLNTTQQLGYANAFTAILGSQSWRAQPSQSGSIQHLNAKPTVFGSQTARVVGQGSQANNLSSTNQQAGTDEICCDKLGRVRIRFQWQDVMDDVGDQASCWIRVII